DQDVGLVEASAVVEQLPHGFDLEPDGVQHPAVEGLPGEQLAQLLVSRPDLLDVLLKLAAAPRRSLAYACRCIHWTRLRCVLWRGPVAAGLPADPSARYSIAVNSSATRPSRSLPAWSLQADTPPLRRPPP